MKTLKFFFYLLTLSTIVSSCTPQSLDDNQTNIHSDDSDTVENTQATGENGGSSDDGSKD